MDTIITKKINIKAAVLCLVFLAAKRYLDVKTVRFVLGEFVGKTFTL
jgi:hypothetical protein